MVVRSACTLEAGRGERAIAYAGEVCEPNEQLFADIPRALRLDRPLALDRGCSEQEVYEELRALAARNVSTDDEISFLGGGMYDHYVPSLIDAIIQRSEFLTPYTPYQPEISQGGLQAMFEYQTAISELTGLPVSNAGLYEGPSSVASAGYLAMAATKRKRFVVSRGLHPHSRETLATYAVGYPRQGYLDEAVPLDQTISPTMTAGKVLTTAEQKSGWTAWGTSAQFTHGDSGGPVLRGDGPTILALHAFTYSASGSCSGVGYSFRVDRPDVAPIVADVPFVLCEKPNWDSGIVLHNHLAVCQKKTAHHREIIRVHEVGCRFE